ncbi:DUF3817 domain-containing protein [Tuwongella immobilis]|uniref:DUF3817 domain-containing protein n=1 Tax=Tuwongella immobilis TaxID=692036 RepID=A0A6C2YLM6_9BACT|nr:DUF3817 domain-containing protein [Tuwongella immobilis]VIP02221.1 Uncharacterized protein OS=Bacillus macauensis ZFHKF-1 GN=A374_07704 PE=4 SV=1: DUF3817 [Tuwongella immobilis]VTS00750.1 Uncharacterized protein OS=Bacillus macauensis ZFHKF-1 GN=A374_07704 PE=4 SV=1: DUF3817 [Tuwongella immobilis]
MRSPFRLLRLIALLEGCSFLFLLGLAMPLKYAAGQSIAVSIVGPIHGLMVILFWITLVITARRVSMRTERIIEGFTSSLLPLGGFVFDRSLQRDELAWRFSSESHLPARGDSPADSANASNASQSANAGGR